jgi:hypothetical protein
MDLKTRKSNLINAINTNKDNYVELKNSINTAYKNKQLFKAICHYLFLEGEDPHTQSYCTLLMLLLKSNSIDLELINLVLPYSDLEYVNERSYGVVQCLLLHAPFNIIMELINKFKPINLFYNELFDDLYNNSKLSTHEIFDVLKKILILNPTKTMLDIKFNYNNVLLELSASYNYCDYDMFKIFIEEYGFDVNIENGLILKNIVDNHYYSPSNEYNFIKLFLDNGYKAKEHKFYDYYISKQNTTQLLDHLKYTNTSNTIYTSVNCPKCYKKYNSNSNINQIAYIPCGHTICNVCDLILTNGNSSDASNVSNASNASNCGICCTKICTRFTIK